VESSTAYINSEALDAEQVFTSSRWLGVSDPVISYSVGRHVDGKLFLANGATDINQSLGGATLEMYSATNANLLDSFGQIPDGTNYLSFSNSALYGSTRFGSGYAPNTTSGIQGEIFSLNANNSGVLSNLTNSTDVNEYLQLN